MGIRSDRSDRKTTPPRTCRETRMNALTRKHSLVVLILFSGVSLPGAVDAVTQGDRQDATEQSHVSHPPMRALPTSAKGLKDKGRVRFVDATRGNDANSGSEQSPWKTLFDSFAYPSSSAESALSASPHPTLPGWFRVCQVGNWLQKQICNPPETSAACRIAGNQMPLNVV